MFNVFTPRLVMPPNWNRIACSTSATRIAGNATHPSIKPSSPFKMRWPDTGPIGMWISDATKKEAERIAVVMIRS